MNATSALDPMAKRAELRHREICSAAIAEFSDRGYAGASMANIAARAGISRPALYQYFDNKSDIFRSAFVSLFQDLVDAARDALESTGSLESQLDQFLQRYSGDLWELMAASPHLNEINAAKDENLGHTVAMTVAPLWRDLDRHLATQPGGKGSGSKNRRQDWVDVLHHAPKGFTLDEPSVDAYRRRLTVLARSIAADVGR